MRACTMSRDYSQAYNFQSRLHHHTVMGIEINRLKKANAKKLILRLKFISGFHSHACISIIGQFSWISWTICFFTVFIASQHFHFLQFGSTFYSISDPFLALCTSILLNFLCCDTDFISMKLMNLRYFSWFCFTQGRTTVTWTIVIQIQIMAAA